MHPSSQSGCAHTLIGTPEAGLLCYPCVMTSPPTLPALLCPLCGGPNGCAVAASGSFEAACWCAGAAFPPALLQRLPASSRGCACICRGCVDTAATAPADQASPG
jgi:hypothetical protein